MASIFLASFQYSLVIWLCFAVKTNVYVDGFNLYYGAVKGTPYKWLDLRALCEALLPTHEINRIRYFTAVVEQRPDDPHKQRRQLTYIRALRTITGLSVHLGQFRTDPRRRPLAHPIQGVPRTVEILETREKGSDVNLATNLIGDGYDNDYEQAVVISNDSDLASPVAMVSSKLHLPVGVINPSPNLRIGAPKQLRDAATFQRRIRKKTLRDCQFPETLSDENGVITKPPEWNNN